MLCSTILVDSAECAMDTVPVDTVKLKAETEGDVKDNRPDGEVERGEFEAEQELLRTYSLVTTPSRRQSSVRVRHRSSSSTSATVNVLPRCNWPEHLSHCPQHCPHQQRGEHPVSYRYVPPDGGWGWMVLLGTIIVNTLIPGLVKSFGVLYVEFMTIFNASPSSVSIIPAITFALYNLLGPVASMISTKVSCRFATILGGLSATIGLALSYFANSIEFMYFSYGVLGGIGAGMSYTPGILMVGQYFDSHRGLANGLCASGSALGSIILPPLLNYLLGEYGCRGTILILCALLMNVCVGAALYQPVERHLKRVPIIIENQEPVETVTLPVKKESQLLSQHPAEVKQLLSRTNNNSFSSVTTDYVAPVNPSPISSRRLMMMLMRRPGSNPRFPQIVSEGRIAILEEDEKVFLTSSNDIGDKRLTINGVNGNQNSVTFTIGATATPVGLGMGSCSGLGTNFALHRSPSMISNISTSSLAYLSTIHHGSIPAAYQLNQIRRESMSGSRTALAAMINSQGSISNFPYTGNSRSQCPICDNWSTVGNKNCFKCMVAQEEQQTMADKKLSACKLMFDISLLQNTVFLLITFSVVASGIAYTNLLIILPAYAISIAVDKSQYTLLLSVIAGTDLIGRISGAWLSDLASFPCKYIYMGGFGVSGLALMFMSQCSSFEGLVASCSVFGFSSGVYIGLMAVLLVKYLGADKLASSFGLSLAINGVVMMVGPPIVGTLGEALGGYGKVILILGLVNFSGGLILILEPIATNFESKKLAASEAVISEKGAVTLV